MSSEDQDLPVFSIESGWKVQHYVFELECSLSNETFKGVVLLFLVPRSSPATNELVLDSRDLTFHGVESVDCSIDQVEQFLTAAKKETCYDTLETWVQSKHRENLNFADKDNWCVRIEMTQEQVLTKTVLVKFSTKPEGLSVLWRQDQDGNKCVYTAGSLVNNRSLFPCQDGPGFMATWQAVIRVPKDFDCLCTGDEPGVLLHWGKKDVFYFSTKMLLPMSTFAIAVGRWRQVANEIFVNEVEISRKISCFHEDYPCHFRERTTNFQYRIYGPQSVNMDAVPSYVSSALKKFSKVFGLIPVCRVDFLVMPRSFGSLGLCSPHLIFVSQSVVMGTNPMLHRISHELSHFWFGVNIGPKNWAEEWMSEGFATYVEDRIHSKLDPRFSTSVRTVNRYCVLQADATNVDDKLQVLAPASNSPLTIKNGLNEEKMFSQIHYIKGYFLLLELEKIVGVRDFIIFLRKYVESFHGCLVSSDEFLEFFQKFCLEKNLSFDVETFKKTWLSQSEFSLDTQQLRRDASYEQVLENFVYWENECRAKQKTKRTKLEVRTNLEADQLIALFDKLLEMDSRIPQSVMKQLVETYNPDNCNPDVAHRFYELAIKNLYSPALERVKSFLVENQSMGVYLYGELLVTERYRYQNTALEVYRQIESQLEPQMKKAIQELLQV